MADSYAETPEGILLVANGFDPVLRWDGLSAQMETAGLDAPAAAMTLAGSGAGPIVGTYYGYLRYLDRFGNLSNLSPISVALDAAGTTGTITAATNATPIVVTSTGHGLHTGDTVKVAGVGGNTSANNTWSVTVVDADTFTLDNSTGTADYTGGGTWTSGVAAVVYSSVEVPTDPKVTTRQLLRNTDGQADTFYVDVETNDLTSTALSSTRTDTDLAAQTAQPILDSSGLPLANSHNVPPSHKAVLAHHLGRMFLAVQHDYRRGACKVTAGSPVVTGVGTEWPASLAGRLLYVVGATRAYAVASVNAAAQTLTLEVPYAGATDALALYAIRPPPGEERLVYYSEAGQCESVPPTNALQLQEDGDEITGLMAKGSFLYILEARHVYRLTFQVDPGIDGAVFLSCDRGCLNHRCWVQVDDAAYLLDEEGVHAFSGGQESTPVSGQVSGLFRPGGDERHRINWRAAPYFHAALYRQQQVVRWFVALAGDDLPRHALCYHYRSQRWWVEEFPAPVGAACAARVAGVPRLLLGSAARRVLAYWEGFLDGPDPAAGTVRGTVTSAGLVSFADAGATFAAAGLVGAPLAIVYGTGKGQVRRVTAVSGTTVSIDQPWQVLPDATSVYQLGAVGWLFRSGWFRLAAGEELAERRLELVFRPAGHPCTLDLRLHADFNEDTALPWEYARSSADGNGVESAADSGDLVADLTKATGVVQQRLPGGKELYLDGRRYLQAVLAGFSNQDPVEVYQLTIDGVVMPGGG